MPANVGYPIYDNDIFKGASIGKFYPSKNTINWTTLKEVEELSEEFKATYTQRVSSDFNFFTREKK